MYKELLVWQKAYRFALNVYKVTNKFPKEELFGITSQMRRASTSISVNIAEGSTRQSKKEFHQFLCVAQGSTTDGNGSMVVLLARSWLYFKRRTPFATRRMY